MQYITPAIANRTIDKAMSDHGGSTLRRSNTLMPKGEKFPAKRKATTATIQRLGTKPCFVRLFVFVFMPSM